MHGWMDGLMDEGRDECIDGWRGVCGRDESVRGWMDEIDGWVGK